MPPHVRYFYFVTLTYFTPINISYFVKKEYTKLLKVLTRKIPGIGLNGGTIILDQFLLKHQGEI